MIPLHPDHGGTLTPLDRVAHENRPAAPGRPWVMTNMIASADGATAIDGRSGGLGGPADREMLVALRSVADAIIVGADTVRAERYRRPWGTAESRSARQARGQAESPLLAVISGSAQLDSNLPMFDSPDYRPLILTSERAPAKRREALEEVADVVVLGTDQVPLRAAIEELAARDLGVVLSEGGPSLNGQLVAEGLIDEWNLTIAPLLAGGESRRPAVWSGETPHPRSPMTLDRVWLGDELLFCRWVRAGDTG
jgi:riboflavin-specific deaminase-like protein